MNTILVAGMGKTGLSIAAHLAGGGFAPAEIYAADTRKHPPMEAEIKKLLGGERCLVGEEFISWPPEKLRRFDFIAPSPGLRPPPSWKLAGGPEILSELRLFAAAGSAKPLMLCVTGTNGKSTAAALVVELCRAAGIAAEVAGNFGEPLLDALSRWRSQPPAAAVAELSSFQLLHGGMPAHAAAVLNISPDHLDYHETFAEYARAKSRIYENAAYCVVNLDCAAAAAPASARRITFSAQDDKADWRWGEDGVCGGGMHFARNEISPALSAETAAAALALFSALQCESANQKPLLKTMPREKLARALAEFPGLPHRRQNAGQYGGVFYINDSKATNVASACFALNSIAGNIILIAGGDGKGQDFSPLAKACGRVKKAFLFGKDADAVRRALAGVECEIVDGMQGAAAGAAKTAAKGDTVLLSPACSSLDMYKNYAERGDAFMAEAKKHAR